MSLLALAGSWLLRAWRFVSESRIAQVAMAIGGAVAWHLMQVSRAERRGRKDEQQQAAQKADTLQKKVKHNIVKRRQAVKQRQRERRAREDASGTRNQLDNHW